MVIIIRREERGGGRGSRQPAGAVKSHLRISRLISWQTFQSVHEDRSVASGDTGTFVRKLNRGHANKTPTYLDISFLLRSRRLLRGLNWKELGRQRHQPSGRSAQSKWEAVHGGRGREAEGQTWRADVAVSATRWCCM